MGENLKVTGDWDQYQSNDLLLGIVDCLSFEIAIWTLDSNQDVWGLGVND